MPRDRAALVIGLAAVAVTAGCEDDEGGPVRLSPSMVSVGDQDRRFLIAGPNPVEYLRGSDGEVRLVDDYVATIGGVATTVVGADGAGVEVTLTAPLAVGVFPLAVTAGARTWRTEAALTVVAEPLDGGADARADGDLADATVDAGPDAAACPPPPVDCTAFACPGSSHCYYVCAERNWTAARNQCGVYGLGCLVTIGDQAENDCIAAATDPMFPALVWTGWRQAASGVEPAGGWDWDCPDGSSYQAPNWGGAEPNNWGGSEDCGAIGAGGTWIDGGCNSIMRFVCEL